MSRTLEDLENDRWGDPPADVTPLIEKCYRLRSKALSRLTTEDFRLLFGQNIGTEHLLPMALDLLETNPFAEGDYYPGDVLHNVVGLPRSYWDKHADHLLRTRSLAARVLALLKQARPSEADLEGSLRRFIERTAAGG